MLRLAAPLVNCAISLPYGLCRARSRKRSGGAPDSPRGPNAKPAGRAQVAPQPEVVEDLRQPSFLKPGIGESYASTFRSSQEFIQAAQQS